MKMRCLLLFGVLLLVLGNVGCDDALLDEPISSLQTEIQFCSDGTVNGYRLEEPESEGTSTKASGGNYIGNRNSKKFHLSSCRYAASMKETNRVFFHSRDEAVSEGYKPCGVCKP